MESAFGVDHGEFSKGIPRALKQPMGGAPKLYGQGRTEAGDYALYRKLAHDAGKGKDPLNRKLGMSTKKKAKRALHQDATLKAMERQF